MASSLGHGRAHANGRTRKGLDDDRVEKVYDGGYKFYRADHQPDDADMQTSSVPPRGDSQILQKTREDLENNVVYYPRHSAKSYFLPLDQLDKVMTLQTIRTLVATMPCCEALSPDEKERFARDIRLGGGRTGRCEKPCVKLLAALLWSKTEHRFLSLVEDGLNDACFPLELLPDNDFKLGCSCQGHEHAFLGGLCPKGSRELSSVSRIFSAPYLRWRPTGHVHYVLGTDDILPIVSKSPASSEPSRTSQGNQRKPGTQAVPENGLGGFGKVYRVIFHSSHYDFDEYGAGRGNGTRHSYALKFLTSSSVDDFDKELASLLSCQNDEEMHLIRLLATIEIREHTDNGIESKFGLIFPWADANLWDFWKKHPGKNERETRCVWMAEQCYRVGQALAHIHNERDDTMLRFHMSDDDQTLYGRHGDLKAENILYFQMANRLVITDFGLGRLHTKISRSHQNPHNLAMTVTYAAPEFELADGKVSRSCDIYALGGTFLEFVTWYLLGEDAVDEFSTWRLEEVQPGFQTDTFYRIKQGPANAMTPILKPKVRSWIDSKLKTSPLFSQYMLEFIDLILNQMLAPLPTQRTSSGLLEKELRKLYQACLSDEDYYQKNISPT